MDHIKDFHRKFLLMARELGRENIDTAVQVTGLDRWFIERLVKAPITAVYDYADSGVMSFTVRTDRRETERFFGQFDEGQTKSEQIVSKMRLLAAAVG